MGRWLLIPSVVGVNLQPPKNQPVGMERHIYDSPCNHHVFLYRTQQEVPARWCPPSTFITWVTKTPWKLVRYITHKNQFVTLELCEPQLNAISWPGAPPCVSYTLWVVWAAMLRGWSLCSSGIKTCPEKKMLRYELSQSMNCYRT